MTSVGKLVRPKLRPHTLWQSRTCFGTFGMFWGSDNYTLYSQMHPIKLRGIVTSPFQGKTDSFRDSCCEQGPALDLNWKFT